MRIGDTVLHALGNLRRQRLRTALTAAGVGIGVWTTAIMMAFPAGVRNILVTKLDRQELLTTMTVLNRKMPLRSFGNLDELRSLDQKMREQKAVPLDDELIAELRKIPGVLTVYPELTAYYTVELDEHVEAGLMIGGIPLDALTQAYVDAIQGGAGRFWEKDSEEEVCVVPSGLLPAFGIERPQEAIGKKLVVSRLVDFQKYRWIPPRNKELAPGETRKLVRPADWKRMGSDSLDQSKGDYHEITVIGVYDSEQLGVLGGRIYVPLAYGEKLYKFDDMKMPWTRKPREGKYNQLTLKCTDRHVVESVRDDLDQRGLGTVMTTDFITALNWIFGLVEAGLGAFGAIALFVSFFGIVNTMVMAILERTREIGVMKAIGARDKDVWLAFVSEAGSIGFLGGAGGIGIALVTCKILNWAATHLLRYPGARELEVFQISVWLGGGLIGFATAVAILAGLYPAWRASRLDPVEALRRE